MLTCWLFCKHASFYRDDRSLSLSLSLNISLPVIRKTADRQTGCKVICFCFAFAFAFAAACVFVLLSLRPGRHGNVVDFEEDVRSLGLWRRFAVASALPTCRLIFSLLLLASLYALSLEKSVLRGPSGRAQLLKLDAPFANWNIQMWISYGWRRLLFGLAPQFVVGI